MPPDPVPAARTPKRKVLWLTKGLAAGGAERLLLSFAQKGDHDRFEFHSAHVLSDLKDLDRDLADAGATVHTLGVQRTWDVRWLWRLRRLLVRENYAVVHNHSPLIAAQARLLVRTLPKQERPRLVTTEHNLWTSHHPLTRALNALTIGMDDDLFAVSDQVRRSMSSRVRRRVEVLVHGVDVGAVAARRSERTEARSELGLDDEDFVVVTVANLRSHKDYPTMLRAARRLANDGVPCKFLAVGRGPLASELEALRDELGLGERFRFLGHRSDPIRVLVAGDAFCLSSMFEGLPIAMVEAMAVGLPVVATEVGGIPTLATGDTAITIVPPQSPDELADALHELHAMLRAEPDAGARNRPAAPDIKTAIRALQAVYMS